MSYEKEYVRGLRDVAACETQNSFVDPLGALYYVGYDIDRLLGRVCYEEVIHLLLYKKLPNQSELNVIRSTLTSEMKIPQQIIQSIRNAPKNIHPIRRRTPTSHTNREKTKHDLFTNPLRNRIQNQRSRKNTMGRHRLRKKKNIHQSFKKRKFTIHFSKRQPTKHAWQTTPN